MRLISRSRTLRNPFLNERGHGIAMNRAALCGHLMFHVERAHAAAAEGHVNNLLVQRQNFIVQRVHIHSLCEKTRLVKG